MVRPSIHPLLLNTNLTFPRWPSKIYTLAKRFCPFSYCNKENEDEEEEDEDEDEKSDGKFATLEDDRKIKAATGGTVRETVDQTVAGYLQSIRSTDAIKKFKRKKERKKYTYIVDNPTESEGDFLFPPFLPFIFPSCIKKNFQFSTTTTNWLRNYKTGFFVGYYSVYRNKPAENLTQGRQKATHHKIDIFFLSFLAAAFWRINLKKTQCTGESTNVSS